MDQQVTMIDQLPDLNDIEAQPQQGSISDPYPNQSYLGSSEFHHQKFIRNTHHISKDAGMQSYANMVPPNNDILSENFQQKNIVESFGNLNCVDVARHAQSCPVCSKLYSNDKTIFIAIIVILIIICLLLLKKVLNV